MGPHDGAPRALAASAAHLAEAAVEKQHAVEMVASKSPSAVPSMGERRAALAASLAASPAHLREKAADAKMVTEEPRATRASGRTRPWMNIVRRACRVGEPPERRRDD